MNHLEIFPVLAVEVIQCGHLVPPISVSATVSSRTVSWSGVALEAHESVPSSSIPEHEHPTHFLSLLTSGKVRAQWTMEGRTQNENHSAGTLYFLPAGSRDVARWSGPSSRIVLVMEPRFLGGILDETAHLRDVELRPNLSFQDRHIAGILGALHADLEDGSPAGSLYGQSLSVALAHCLIRQFAVRTTMPRKYANGMPPLRLNRVIDFMQENCSKETRLWELAEIAGMSPHYFCELFKRSTGCTPYQYTLRCRIDRAKQLLGFRHFTIRQVAESTGFADQSHFTKVFRRMVGLTPLEFRD